MSGEVRRSLIRFRNAVRPAAAESELGREMAAHLALLEDENIRRGLTPEAARLEARRSFGGIEQAKERQRDSRSFVWVDDGLRDLRHAASLLRRRPLFTFTAAVSIAIGIGANTAVFTVANALLLRQPAGVLDPHRLVDIGSTRHEFGFAPASFPNYVDIRQRTTTLDDVYALPLFPQAMSLSGADRRDAKRVFVTPVTVNYFHALGAVPAVGRLFDARDSDEPPASPLAVISHDFWTRTFNRDPAVAGRTLTLNGQLYTIIGVAAEGFHGTGVRGGDAWIPLGMGGGIANNRAAAWLLIGARVKAGLTRTQAAAEIDAIGRSLQRDYPDENRDKGLRAEALSPVPGNTGAVAAFVVLLTGIVLIVLVIACANIVGVLLARAAARRTEIAVRLAMGAGRSRLVRQLLTETLLLFTVGGGLGLLLARVATAVIGSRLPRLPFPIQVSLAIDGRAIAFTAGLALLAAIGSGLIPALQSSKDSVVSALKDDARAPHRQRLRHLFVVAQIAFSILLVAVAGLFVRSLELAGSSDPGFDPSNIELASLDLSQAGYTKATGPEFARLLLESVRSLGVVESASTALVLPGGFETGETMVQIPGVAAPDGQQGFSVDWNGVEPGYFSTMRIPIVSGRDFTDSDRQDAQDVAIVGESLARQFWSGHDPIGQTLLQPTIGALGPTGAIRSLRVVGVVRDVKASSLIDGLAHSLVHMPLQQQFFPRVTLVVRSRQRQHLSDDLRATVARLNPNLPVTIETFSEYSALGLLPQRIATSLAGSLGFVGLLLAGIGIYGVTAYMVTARTREFGIRLALGASKANVLRTVLGHGLAITAVGSTLGLLLAAGAGQLLTAFLFGASPIDVWMFSVAATLFVLVGLAACVVPALNATVIHPLEALRCE